MRPLAGTHSETPGNQVAKLPGCALQSHRPTVGSALTPLLWDAGKTTVPEYSQY